MARQMWGYVYLVEVVYFDEPTGIFKIGYSGKPYRRLVEILNDVRCGLPLGVREYVALRYLSYFEVADCRGAEGLLHLSFGFNRVSPDDLLGKPHLRRCRGREWFSLCGLTYRDLIKRSWSVLSKYDHLLSVDVSPQLRPRHPRPSDIARIKKPRL